MVDERTLPVEDRLERLLVRFEQAVDRFERKVNESPTTDYNDTKNEEP